MRRSLGQAPLIFGPSSWGFPMIQGGTQLVCPPGTLLLPNGNCVRATATVRALSGPRVLRPGSPR